MTRFARLVVCALALALAHAAIGSQASIGSDAFVASLMSRVHTEGAVAAVRSADPITAASAAFRTKFITSGALPEVGVRQAGDSVCLPLTSCQACTLNPACVWALTVTRTSDWGESTIGPYSTVHKCFPGTATGGPTARTDDAAGEGFVNAHSFYDLFGGSEREDRPLFWSSEQPCAEPIVYGASEDEGNTEFTSTEATFRRSVSQFPVTYAPALTTAELRDIGEKVRQMSEADRGFDTFGYFLVRLIAPIYRGVVGVVTVFNVDGGPLASSVAPSPPAPSSSSDSGSLGGGAGSADEFPLERAALGVASFGLNLGGVLDFAAEAIFADRETTAAEFRAAGVMTSSSAFVVVFDRAFFATVPAGTGVAPGFNARVNVPVNELSVTLSTPVDLANNVTVQHVRASGAIGSSAFGTFALDCYFGSDEFVHLGRTVANGELECDVTMSGLAAASGEVAGLQMVVITVDTASVLGGANGISSVGSAGLFLTLPTANVTGSASNAAASVISTTDPACTNVDFLTTAVREKLATALNGGVKTTCLLYTFDSVDPTSVFWDPTVGVDENAALAESSGALLAPSRGSSKKTNWVLYGAIAGGVLVVLAIGVVVAVVVIKKKKKSANNSRPSSSALTAA